MSCTKCNDTGWYAYDHNHSAICDQCCRHLGGVWLLDEYYQDAGKWCCRTGCGTVWDTEEAYLAAITDAAFARGSADGYRYAMRSAEIVEDWHGRAKTSYVETSDN